jgi:arsenate reductase (thioredoxin)
MRKKNVLVLCTGNSCRSIMAEALINHDLGDRWQAYSAGVEPAGKVNRHALRVLEELGLDTSNLRSKSVDEFLNRDDLDLVVTVCDHAHETCPIFPKPVQQIHVPFEDPHRYTHLPEEKALPKYRETRDKIRSELLPCLEQM